MYKDWKTLVLEELQAYIGLCILRGVYKSKNQAVRQLWNPLFGPPIFSKTMSVNRFEQIRGALRFDNPTTRKSSQARDKLAAVRLLLDGFVENSHRCYQHSECVTVDEQLYPFRGRCSYIQYMPSKPAKYGLKFWIVADANSYYVSDIEMYTGKDEERTRELGMHIVLKLTAHLHGTGRNVTCDNFFTSLNLARELSFKRMSLVGTIRSNRREVPKELWEIKKRGLYESVFAYSEEGMQIVSYKAKKNKNVFLLSSQHKDEKLSEGKTKKPEVILYYNSTKGGVDCVDERVGTYSVKYTSKRWHVPVWCNLLDLTCYNAFILYTCVFPNYQNGKSHKRRLFLSELGMALSQKYRESRKANTSSSNPEEDRLAPAPSVPSKKRARCKACPRGRDRKSSTKCNMCGEFVCPDHYFVMCHSCKE